jgi:hypothetical protein
LTSAPQRYVVFVLTIDARYNGPPGSANGGYACGAVAAALPDGAGAAEVTLRTPPPLDAPMRIKPRDDGIVVLSDDDVLVAEGHRVAAEFDSPSAVDFEMAVQASRGYPGFEHHSYPGCFVCGPERAIGDGLRLFPGAVSGRRVVAAPWIPNDSVGDEDGVVRDEVLWGALDCPSWFAWSAFEPFDGRPLLGRLAAEILERPRAGDRLVSVAWPISRDGRKIYAGASLFTAAGALLARSRATWLTVPD